MNQSIIEAEGGIEVARGKPATRRAHADQLCSECHGYGYHYYPETGKADECECVKLACDF